MKTVTVYCGSSNRCHDSYLSAASRLGQLLASNEVTLVYGGGSIGPMGRLATAALTAGGRVIGYMPKFMCEIEWAHTGLTELKITESMHERKLGMLNAANAIIALPGGSGTFEELFEAITMKRLGIFLGPIVLVNTNGFFDPCINLLERCILENFMDSRHSEMWTVVNEPDDVMSALKNAPSWSSDAISFATQK